MVEIDGSHPHVPSSHAVAAPANALVVRQLDPISNERELMRGLYRANSAALGFLPQGAFDEFVNEGTVLVAMADSTLIGYVAYRLTGRSAKIVHLCVDTARRGQGIARLLVEALFRETAGLDDVRLLCREDYAATNLWPRLGFVCMNEKLGRGKDGCRLFLWVRRNSGPPPLLAAIDAAARANRRAAAVDANVFYDFDGDDERSHESQGLLADWLADDVVVCVTAEIRNEISRHSNAALRARRRTRVEDFTVLDAPPDRFNAALELIESLLPGASRVSDDSDRRQLAHAVGEQAEFFVTRDEVLLAHAPVLRECASIEVLRPTDFLVRLHSQTERYAPARLVGTSVTECRATAEAEVASFQRFASAETKGAWLQRMRPLLTDPQRFQTSIVSWDGAARAAYSVDRGESVVTIPLLRAHRDPRAPTVLRRILAEVLVRAQTPAPVVVRCDDVGDPMVESALTDVGFALRDGCFEKWMMRAIIDVDQLGTVVPPSFIPLDAEHDTVERSCWPLKIRGGRVDSYVIPIRPHWAAQLFDSDLASRDLFGARQETALALENVYYSSSLVHIPAGARILWYVSGDIQEVRACSISLGSVRAPARQLFRQFSRLGIYSWADLMRSTDRQPEQPLFAYRFAYTERFGEPIPWAQLQATLTQQQGRGNPIAGPSRISEQAFLDVYRAATGI